jgi:hypothetical protein
MAKLSFDQDALVRKHGFSGCASWIIGNCICLVLLELQGSLFLVMPYLCNIYCYVIWLF